ncbi:hypothetical protein KR054_004261 [Drosophila jambulina]|nr:hypothetical protein KR054_004261 [Drosophila jambulina]
MPSFDEPSLRATFNVTMGHHKRFQSFSNMQVRAILPNPDLPDYVWSVHEATPTIATYQLAFSVNNFTCSFSQAVSSSSMHFRTCSRPSDLPETSLAARVAPQLLQFFEDRLGVRLPLDKIDQLVVDRVPVPSTQTLGFIVYRSKGMLQLDEGPMTQAKMQALQMIAHEIAHMWFGNLMTVDSRSDLWLTEGLNGFFGALGMDHLQPGVLRRVLLHYREMAFMYEGQVGGMTLAPLEPIKKRVNEASLFQKAKALIVMLNGFLGNATFYDGIQRHLWQNSFGGSTPYFLWRSLQLARERQPDSPPLAEQLRSIMDTWTQQEGYPLVTVKRNGTAVILTQSSAFNESRKERWWIPVTYAVQAQPNFFDLRPKAWMNPAEKHLVLNVSVPKDQWIVFNLHAKGYYRVQYDEDTWELLATTLFADYRRIHVLSRAQIVSDVLFLHMHNRLGWGTTLNVLKYIVDEDEQEPLMAFVLGLAHGYWGFKPESSMFIAKWLGIAGKWYAEFITHTFDKFVLKQNLNSLD